MTLRSLEQRGLITRRQADADGRRVVVDITGTGLRTLALRDHAVIDRLGRVIANSLTESDKRQLPRMTEILEKIAAEL